MPRAGSPRTQKHLEVVQRSHCCLHAAQRVRCLTIRTFRGRNLQHTLAHSGHSSIRWELQTRCVHPCLAQLSAMLPNLLRIRRVASSSAHVQTFFSFFPKMQPITVWPYNKSKKRWLTPQREEAQTKTHECNLSQQKKNGSGHVTPHRWMHKLSRTRLKNCTAT